MTKEEQFQEYVEYAKMHMCDLIPYNYPDYDNKLQQMAESYADMEINGYPDELESLCKEHDEYLDPSVNLKIMEDFENSMPW